MATVYGTGTKRTAADARRKRGSPMRTDAAPAEGSLSADLPPTRENGNASPFARTSSVNSLIEEQIIPRLLLAHSADLPRSRATGTLSVDPADAARFASLPLDLDADELFEVVDSFIQRGISIESVFVDLLAPSARRLGQHWEEDECDFLDVTMGLWRLQEVMRQVALRYPAEEFDGNHSRSALFSPLPGDRHALGTLMVEEVFARAGWQTEALIEPKRKELLQIIAERHFDVIGLTVSCDCTNASLSDLICAIRSVSRAPGIQVFIGGRMVNANPGIVDEVGADGTAPDARSALVLAEKLIEKKLGGSIRFDLPLG
jgi:MerR family transcriptional regulator, light-induced transcriptional regulator